MWDIKTLLNKTVKQFSTVEKNWKPGMWVVTQQGKIGVLVSVTSPCIIHTVDKQDGTTLECITLDINNLRQALWEEIPECRRGITQEQGKALGYGS